MEYKTSVSEKTREKMAELPVSMKSEMLESWTYIRGCVISLHDRTTVFRKLQVEFDCMFVFECFMSTLV